MSNIKISKNIQTILLKLEENDLVKKLIENIVKFELNNIHNKELLTEDGVFTDSIHDIFRFYNELYCNFLERVDIENIGQFIFDDVVYDCVIKELKKEFIIYGNVVINRKDINEKINDLLKIYMYTTIDYGTIEEIQFYYVNGKLREYGESIIIDIYEICDDLISKYDLNIILKDIPLNAPYTLYEYLIEKNVMNKVFEELFDKISEENSYKKSIFKDILELEYLRYWTNNYLNVENNLWLDNVERIIDDNHLNINIHMYDYYNDYLKFIDLIDNTIYELLICYYFKCED